jgi:hypothetical protein
MIDQKQLENVEYFNHLDSIIDYERFTCEIISRIPTSKAAFQKKKTLFRRKLDLNLRTKPVKCYIWSIALYGAESWTFRKVDQKYVESFEMWCWRRIWKIGMIDGS